MPDSNSPYVTVGAPPLLDMLKGQLISSTEDRRRVMLWSAILALGSLMLLGKVASVPWFLALVPLVLLAIWNACLLVRQRRYQAVWDGLMEKAGDPKSSAATKAAAAAISAPELGARDVPAVLSALVAPSVLLFHGLLLGAVVTGGVVHEVDHDAGSNSHIAKGKSESSGSSCGCGGGGGVAGAKSEGSGCGCGGGGGSSVAAKSTPPTTRQPSQLPPRNFNNPPNRPAQGPPNVAYPARPAPQLPGSGGQPRQAPQPAPAIPAPQPAGVGTAPVAVPLTPQSPGPTAAPAVPGALRPSSVPPSPAPVIPAPEAGARPAASAPQPQAFPRSS